MARQLDDRSLWRLDTFRVSGRSRAGERIAIDGAEGHHAARVMRVRPGDFVRLIDGEGWEAVARAVAVTSRAVDAEVLDSRTRARSEGTSLTIAQALLKGHGFDEAVKRCSELGVAEIVPLVTARAQVRRAPVEARLERWRAIALASVKQSRGVFVPSVRDVATVESLADTLPGCGVYVAWEEATDSFREALRADGPRSSMLAVIGPEGGLSADEVGVLSDAGAKPVTLGSRILRADWAAATVATVIAHEAGGLLP